MRAVWKNTSTRNANVLLTFSCSLWLSYHWCNRICFFPHSYSTTSYCNLSFFIHLICIMDIIFSNMNINLQGKNHRMNKKRYIAIFSWACYSNEMYGYATTHTCRLQNEYEIIYGNFLLECFSTFHWHSALLKANDFMKWIQIKMKIWNVYKKRLEKRCTFRRWQSNWKFFDIEWKLYVNSSEPEISNDQNIWPR